MDGFLCLPSSSRKCDINITWTYESQRFHNPHQYSNRKGNEIYDYRMAVYITSEQF